MAYDDVLTPSVLAALDELYARSALIDGKQVSAVIGISTKMLVRAGNEGKIAFSVKGTKARQYTREAVEEYLTGKARLSSSPRPQPVRRKVRTAPAPRSKTTRARSTTPSELAKQRAELLKRWKVEKEKKLPTA